jgi:alkanesulfonate monooxygenase SsuD/methylene tetrahydromethanopterin reductase-like flavin-dependent oxidoreductase (luciferase family)
VKYGVCVANFGSYADPHAAVRIARAAEEAGWDGFFMWDHLAFVWNGPSADPWVTLTAAACATERLVLGTALTPVPRRRPQVLAEQLTTLTALSGGRVVLGAGLGGNEREFTAFGESADPHVRARLLDDGLEAIRERWDGSIWIGGNSRPALRRAARWDGWLPNSLEPHRIAMDAATLERHVSTLPQREGFEIVFNGYSETAADATPYEAAGATWWLENVHDRRLDAEAAAARVAAGPPR